MKLLTKKSAVLVALFALSSCVTQKKFAALQQNYDKLNDELRGCNEQKDLCNSNLSTCTSNLNVCRTSLSDKQEQYNQLKDQLSDCQSQRNKQLTQVGDLTVLSQQANENINKTLAQMQDKDKYIRLLLEAKSKADSINLALAINLKGVLKEGIDDKDIDIKVDKTVVYVDLSDKMLFNTGKYVITARAREVLGKIATIVSSRPELDVMVEGYTDNVPIKTECMADNWDLSVKRATSVVRDLQVEYHVDPNKLIAAGRGEYNTLASNDDAEGRAINRRTRIIILPKLNQFYDLLDPSKAAK